METTVSDLGPLKKGGDWAHWRTLKDLNYTDIGGRQGGKKEMGSVVVRGWEDAVKGP